jgi:hypothetical protein
LIEGRATFTIVWSRTIIRKPVHRMINASHRESADRTRRNLVPLLILTRLVWATLLFNRISPPIYSSY